MTVSLRSGEKPRLLQLDVLRGVAILLVVFHHAVMTPSETGRLAPIASFLQRFGWTGVDLFFVLSGFLVGGLLFDEIKREGSLDIRRFLTRRALRIWPSYFLYLAFAWLFLVRKAGLRVATLRTNAAEAARALVANLVHLQNYLGSPAIAVHTWSLAVEEHFYIVLPVALYVLLRTKRGLRLYPIVVAATSVIALMLRLERLRDPISSYAAVYHETQYRIDSLLFGTLLAYFYHFDRERLRAIAARKWLPFASVVLLAPAAFWEGETPFIWTFGYSFLYLGFGGLLLLLVFGKTPTGWFAKTTAYVGTFSYTMYLWHFGLVRGPLQKAVTQGFLSSLPGGIRFLIVQSIYISASLLAAVATAYAVERPLLALRERWLPSRARSVPSSACARTDAPASRSPIESSAE